jgi:hypothetical protein
LCNGEPAVIWYEFRKTGKTDFHGSNLGRILSHEVIALRFSVLKTEDEDSQIEMHITISTSPLNPIPSPLFERSQRGKLEVIEKMEKSIDDEFCLQHFPEVTSIDGISGIADGRSQNFEMFLARTEFKKKVADVKLLKKMNDIAHIELQATERNFDELKDSVEAKEKMAAKKQKIMAKLNITNQMLIQTLNTLELNTDIVDGFLSSQITSSNEDSNIILSKNNDTYLQNLKLKESLLNLTRDHYRAADGIRHMGTGIEELRHSLQGYLCYL